MQRRIRNQITRNKCFWLKTFLVGLLILSFLALGRGFFTDAWVDAASGYDYVDLAPADKEVPIYYYDYPGSYFGIALETIFPASDRIRLTHELSIFSDNAEDAFYLLSENQVYPFLRQSISYGAHHFKRLFRASLVIGVNPKKINSDIYSWRDLQSTLDKNPDLRVGFLMEPEYLLNSLSLSDDSKELRDDVLRKLGEVHAKSNLDIFRGELTNKAWPLGVMTSNLASGDLPEILIMWDYQAAQINIKMKEGPYNFHVPREGSLVLDLGLLARGELAKEVLDRRIQGDTEDKLAINLLFYGYRIADGSYPRNQSTVSNQAWYENIPLNFTYNYPVPEEYGYKQLKISNYEQFNQDLIRNRAIFKRDVLGHNYLVPANAEQEHIVLSIFLPLFYIWIATVYFRLDNQSIMKSMGLLLFWLSLAIVMYFIQMMYSGILQSGVLYYIRFLPFFGMVEAWFFTGVNLAKANKIIDKKQSVFAFLLTLVYYATSIAYIFNNLHGFTFGLNPYQQVTEFRPLFYVMAAYVFILWTIGFILLLRCQARVYRVTFVYPFISFLLLFVANLYFFLTVKSISDGSFDLLNILGSILVIEISLRVRVIPANSGYITLFRYSPVKLRLLSDDLSEVYPPEYNISKRNMANIRRSIKEELAKPAEDLMLNNGATAMLVSTRSVRVPHVKDNGIIFNISKLNSGYLVWEDDISEMKRLKDELSEISLAHEQQAQMLAKETSIMGQYLSMRYRRRMLRNLEKSLSKQISEIRQSVSGISSSEDKAFVRQELSRVKIMVSQCKRKSNLLVRGEEVIQLEEVKLILNEALQDALTSNIKGFVVCDGDASVPTNELIIVYDYLQMILQKSVDIENPFLFINFRYVTGNLHFQIIYNSATKVPSEFFGMEEVEPNLLGSKKLEFFVDDSEGDCVIRIEINQED